MLSHSMHARRRQCTENFFHCEDVSLLLVEILGITRVQRSGGSRKGIEAS